MGRNIKADRRPLVVGIGGSIRSGSSSERALKITLDMLREAGCETYAIAGPALNLPPYDPETAKVNPQAVTLIELLRRADCIVLSSPGYHGSISGIVKNVLDYTEEMRDDDAPYFEGRAIGCIVCASGHQAMGTTLVAMRSIVHALRGWPTPFAATILTGVPSSGSESESWMPGLRIVASQVTAFAFSSMSRLNSSAAMLSPRAAVG
jgi:FMN reductase